METEKAVQLTEHNLVLEQRDNEVQRSYRILAATAEASNILLTGKNFDEAVNKALKIIGQTIDVDRVLAIEDWHNTLEPLIPYWRILYEWNSSRVCVIQNIEDTNSKTSGFMRCVYEWNSKFASPQIHDPEFKEFSNDGLEEWFDKVKNGSEDYVGGTIDEVPQAYINAFIKLEIQSTYNVSIFVGARFWGIIGIDFCREARRLTPAEIAVFKTAASCVGSAIYRQQIQQEKEQAELAILEERNRMAREIHDTLAQAFTGISLQLEAAKSNLTTTESDAVRERYFKCKEKIEWI